jgi:hypothetical protein
MLLRVMFGFVAVLFEAQHAFLVRDYVFLLQHTQYPVVGQKG